MINKTINPEDKLLVLLPAQDIPDGATVSKRTGDMEYSLKHSVSFYGVEGGKKVLVEGFFLYSTRADINQVKPGTLLHWHVTAEDLVYTLKLSWEPEDQ